MPLHDTQSHSILRFGEPLNVPKPSVEALSESRLLRLKTTKIRKLNASGEDVSFC